MISFSRFVGSFKDAFRGVVHVYKKEQNFRVQFFVGLLVLALLFVLPLRTWENVVMILMVALVLVMELLNTAIENFADLLKPRVHPSIGLIKDVMAAAVLITSFAALVIGLMILFPHFIGFFK